jgi:hypothetical protein
MSNRATAALVIALCLLGSLLPTPVLSQGVVAHGNLFGSRCRQGKSSKRCGLFNLGSVMHQGTPGTSGCKEKCVSFQFLSRAYDCGVCGAIKTNAPPTAPAPAPVQVLAPIRAPAPGPVPATAFNKACTPDSSILVFTGHTEAISMKKGTINVTWNPAFVYELTLTLTATTKLSCRIRPYAYSRPKCSRVPDWFVTPSGH